MFILAHLNIYYIYGKKPIYDKFWTRQAFIIKIFGLFIPIPNKRLNLIEVCQLEVPIRVIICYDKILIDLFISS
jgi:hypothetical protein